MAGVVRALAGGHHRTVTLFDLLAVVGVGQVGDDAFKRGDTVDQPGGKRLLGQKRPALPELNAGFRSVDAAGPRDRLMNIAWMSSTRACRCSEADSVSGSCELFSALNFTERVIGEILDAARDYMAEFEISQGELAKALGVSTTYISNLFSRSRISAVTSSP